MTPFRQSAYNCEISRKHCENYNFIKIVIDYLNESHAIWNHEIISFQGFPRQFFVINIGHVAVISCNLIQGAQLTQLMKDPLREIKFLS